MSDEQPTESEIRELFRNKGRNVEDVNLPDDDEDNDLTHSVKKLLSRSSREFSKRILEDYQRANSMYAGARKTRTRIPITFDKEELQFLIDLTNAVGDGRLEIPDNNPEIAPRLYNEFLAVRRNWEDEAYNNGEFF